MSTGPILPTTDELLTTARIAISLSAGCGDVAAAIVASLTVAHAVYEHNMTAEYILAGSQNKVGDAQTKTDLDANAKFERALGRTKVVKDYYSEENECNPVVLSTAREAWLAALVDPYDGSKNEAFDWPRGSIMGLADAAHPDRLGAHIHGAVVVQYGSKIVIAIATKDRPCQLIKLASDGFVPLRPKRPAFQYPRVAKYFMVAGQMDAVPEDLLIELCRAGMKLRTSGCLAADLIFSLTTGCKGLGRAKSEPLQLAGWQTTGTGCEASGEASGDTEPDNGDGALFLCPSARLRVLYEIIPVGFIVKRAGGAAYALVDGYPCDIEHLDTSNPNAKAGFVFGSPESVECALSYLCPGMQSFSA